jgi:hypothetical protein
VLGIEKRLSRARDPKAAAFRAEYRPPRHDELLIVPAHHGRKLGLELDGADMTAAHAMASVTRMNDVNFRPLRGLFVQIGRLTRVNELSAGTDDVVAAEAKVTEVGIAAPARLDGLATTLDALDAAARSVGAASDEVGAAVVDLAPGARHGEETRAPGHAPLRRTPLRPSGLGGASPVADPRPVDARLPPRPFPSGHSARRMSPGSRRALPRPRSGRAARQMRSTTRPSIVPCRIRSNTALTLSSASQA